MSETPNLIIVGYEDEAILAGVETIRKWYGIHEPKDVILIDDKQRIIEVATIDKLDEYIKEGTFPGYLTGVREKFKKRMADGIKPKRVEGYIHDSTSKSKLKRLTRGSNLTPPSPSQIRKRKNKLARTSRKQNRKH